MCEEDSRVQQLHDNLVRFQVTWLLFINMERSAGVAPEVNLRETCTPLPSVNKAAHSGFDTQSKCH